MYANENPTKQQSSHVFRTSHPYVCHAIHINDWCVTHSSYECDTPSHVIRTCATSHICTHTCENAKIHRSNAARSLTRAHSSNLPRSRPYFQCTHVHACVNTDKNRRASNLAIACCRAARNSFSAYTHMCVCIQMRTNDKHTSNLAISLAIAHCSGLPRSTIEGESPCRNDTCVDSFRVRPRVRV